MPGIEEQSEAHTMLKHISTCIQTGDLPQELRLGSAILGVLKDPDEPAADGLDRIKVDGTIAQRVVSHGGKENLIQVEVPGKGLWTFDGTTGKLTE